MVVYNHRPDAASIAIALRHVGHVILVDNSTDKSVSDYLDSLVTERSDKCILIRPGGNIGLSRAYNLAINSAKSVGAIWIHLADHDAILSEDLFVSTHELWMSLSERKVRVGGIVPIVSDDRTLLDRGIGLRCRAFTLSSTITSGLFTRIDIIEAVGGFNEKLFVEGADFELTNRMRLKGWKLYCMNKVLIVQDFENPIENDRFPTWLGYKLTRFRSLVRVAIGNCNIYRTRLSTYNERRWSELLTTLKELRKSDVKVMATVVYLLDRLEYSFIKDFCQPTQPKARDDTHRESSVHERSPP